MKIGIYGRVEVAVCASGMSLKKRKLNCPFPPGPLPLPRPPLLMSSIGPQVVRRGVVVGGHSFLPQPPEGRRMLKITGMALS